MGVIDQYRDELRAIGRAVRAARKERKLSQEALAELADIHRNYVGQIERGERNAPATTLIGLARVLGVTPASLFDKVR